MLEVANRIRSKLLLFTDSILQSEENQIYFDNLAKCSISDFKVEMKEAFSYQTGENQLKRPVRKSISDVRSDIKRRCSSKLPSIENKVVSFSSASCSSSKEIIEKGLDTLYKISDTLKSREKIPLHNAIKSLDLSEVELQHFGSSTNLCTLCTVRSQENPKQKSRSINKSRPKRLLHPRKNHSIHNLIKLCSL